MLQNNGFFGGGMERRDVTGDHMPCKHILATWPLPILGILGNFLFQLL